MGKYQDEYRELLKKDAAKAKAKKEASAKKTAPPEKAAPKGIRGIMRGRHDAIEKAVNGNAKKKK